MTDSKYFQMHQWRPISAERYLKELGMLGMTVISGCELKVVSDELPDTRLRLTTYATVKPQPFEGVVEEQPFLVVLYDVEGDKAACLIRTDVDAAYLDN